MSAIRFAWPMTITICATCITACAGLSPNGDGSLSNISPDEIPDSAVRISSLVTKSVAITVPSAGTQNVPPAGS